jgi:glycine/D-amino acid oxidase-like deaminating enzyme
MHFVMQKDKIRAAEDITSDTPVLAPLWDAAPLPPRRYPQLRDDIDVDLAVVGGGFSGLSTALSYADNGGSVAVLEAGDIGTGASGRSGGQVIPGLRHFTDELVGKYGTDKGLVAHRFGADAAERAFALIARYGIACDARQSGKIQVADTAPGALDARRRFDAWSGRGAPVEFLEGPALADALGTDAYLAGWRDRRGGTVQPLALARGLAVAAEACGASIHTRSRVNAVARSGSAWVLSTDGGGTVTAKNLLLATNATTDGLWRGLERNILRVWSYQIATVPLGAAAARILPANEAVSDTRRVIRYFRKETDGRVVLGGKGLIRAPKRRADFAFQQRTLARLYPGLADAEIAHAWGGEVAITPDRLPRIVRIGPNALAHLGCNGKGVAWCTAIGAAFAEAFATGDDRALPVPVTATEPIPFHSLRNFYVGAGGAWLRFRDAIDGTQSPSVVRSGSDA